MSKEERSTFKIGDWVVSKAGILYAVKEQQDIFAKKAQVITVSETKDHWYLETNLHRNHVQDGFVHARDAKNYALDCAVFAIKHVVDQPNYIEPKEEDNG